MASAWTRIVVATLVALSHGALRTNAVCNKTLGAKVFAQCQDLASLGATYAWTLNDATNSVDFAFSEGVQVAGGWIAWGINPTKGPQMEGTQALVAFENDTSLTVKEYDVTAAVRRNGAALRPTPVTVKYTNVSAVMVARTVTIFGTFTLAPGQASTVSQVWNRGPSVDLTTFTLARHSLELANRNSAVNVDLSTGIATIVSPPHQKLRNAHGVINVVAWGILLPLGVMAARYLRHLKWADPFWFYLHIACQLVGYTLGVVGWGVGLQLQKYTTPIKYLHRNLGITIFVFATLQVLAMVLRPRKDSKVRTCWNVYHHTVGYATIILIIFNIFEGINLLQPENKWKSAYISVLVILAILAAVLEVTTWMSWFRHWQPVKKLEPVDTNMNTDKISRVEAAKNPDSPV